MSATFEARQLAGRHALVTGAGGGIGEAIARVLAGTGLRLSLLGRTPGPLAALAAALGDGARAIPADVTDAAALARALDEARAAHGPVDVLVNSAGAVLTAPFGRIDDAHWEAMLAVNLTAAFRLARALVPEMTARGWGRVVNVASTAGLKGYPYVAAYVAAKHGLVGLTRALALETARTGVTVNAVCPGYTDTGLIDRSVAHVAARTGRRPEAVRAALVGSNPQGRLVRPQEVASAVLWLCLPASAAVTGQAIAIAGGEVT